MSTINITIPRLICVERRNSNFREVNKIFTQIIGKKYTGDGKSPFGNTVDYMHYPPMNFGKFTNKVQHKRQVKSYTLISLELLKEIIKQNKLKSH